MSELTRYAKIKTVMPREFILLQGTGCRWKKCRFCDYYNDCSLDPFAVNRRVLEQVDGEFGVLDVINSGSAMELDGQTLEAVRQAADDKKIHTLWFEAHWIYHKNLKAFAEKFPRQAVYFRCGVETFDPGMRRIWNKGIPDFIGARQIAEYYRGICLLVGVQGQTKAQILRDLQLARQYFDYYSVNVFVPNTTQIQRDEALAGWFIHEIAPELRKEPGAEVLIDNKDLGVG